MMERGKMERGVVELVDTESLVPQEHLLRKVDKAVCDLAIDPDEAEIVKLIFQKYVYEGYGSQRICRYLAEQGFHNRKGGKIPTTSINRIIKNPLYIDILCNGESKSAEVLTDLQIVDVELFERAQNIVQSRAKPHASNKGEIPLTTRGQSLLVGNVYCGHCGRRLTLTTCGQKYLLGVLLELEDLILRHHVSSFHGCFQIA